ncbi:helix-turn-helix domain-containing protein [Paenibacillus albidus]|uniref:helix-turn-helix domain-containing protein n=1 Tax=Paenibacillus albidus TaxID=2041023 RepID=UPI001BE7A2F4|nr:helix-turn-helix domain-containing protein [Paenibacillus albidus]MBT2293119.1 helix-turn-helix domain-containing protein [Paenibacillus albidus]
MTKRLGQDFEELLAEAREIPEVREYLDSFSVIVGDMVYARRMQLNLSQQELANRAETTQKRISLIEAAKGNVGQDVLDRVFRELKLKKLDAHFEELSVARA